MKVRAYFEEIPGNDYYVAKVTFIGDGFSYEEQLARHYLDTDYSWKFMVVGKYTAVERSCLKVLLDTEDAMDLMSQMKALDMKFVAKEAEEKARKTDDEKLAAWAIEGDSAP